MSQKRNLKGPDYNTGSEASRLPRLPQDLVNDARLQKDRRQYDRNDADRRYSDRAVVDAKASLSSSLQQKFEGRLFNLSASGCAVRLPPGTFKVGDSVWFRIEAVQPWRGIVRWVEGGKVGVEFERPFYQSVFELIAETNKPATISRAA